MSYEKTQMIKNSLTCHCFYDHSEVSFAISQGYVASTMCQMSYSLQVGPSWLGELCGMGYKKRGITVNLLKQQLILQTKEIKATHLARKAKMKWSNKQLLSGQEM